MVIAFQSIRASAVLAERSVPLLDQLDPVTRTKALMALLGLVLLLVTMIACVMIGGRWVRRLAQHRPRTTSVSKRLSWKLKHGMPIVKTKASTEDTLLSEQPTDETLTD